MEPNRGDGNEEHRPVPHDDGMGKPEEKGDNKDEGKGDKEGKGKGDKDDDEMVPFEGPDWGPKDFHFIEKTLNVVSVSLSVIIFDGAPFEGADWAPWDFHGIEKTLNVVSVIHI